MYSMRDDTDVVPRCFSVIHHEGEEEHKDDDSDYQPSDEELEFDTAAHQILLDLEVHEAQSSAATPRVSPQTPSIT